MLCLGETTYLVYTGLLNPLFYGLVDEFLLFCVCALFVQHAVLECKTTFTQTLVWVAPDCVIKTRVFKLMSFL